MYSCFFYFPLYISRLFVSSCFVLLSSLLTRLPSDFFCSHPSSSALPPPPPPSSSSSWSCLASSFKYSRGYIQIFPRLYFITYYSPLFTDSTFLAVSSFYNNLSLPLGSLTRFDVFLNVFCLPFSNYPCFFLFLFYFFNL
jgi:hypothetical protein